MVLAATDRRAAADAEAAAGGAAAEQAARDHERAKCQAKAGWTVIVGGVDPAKEAHRAELSASKLSQLKKRASEAGVSQEDLDDADDADDTDGIKMAVIDLILTAEMPEHTAPGNNLRKELSALKVSALKQRAVDAGVSAHALEEADDADDRKGVLVQLILAPAACSYGVGGSTPGSPDETEPGSARSCRAAGCVALVAARGVLLGGGGLLLPAERRGRLGASL